MAYPDVAKPATVSNEPALNVEQLGGPLDQTNSIALSEIQASRLSRLYALSFCSASTIASLALAVSR
jgi:hypothetical protein